MNLGFTRQISPLRFFSACFFAFLIIYNITFRVNEVVTTGRISVAILLIWFLLKGGIRRFRLGLKIYALFIPIPYVLIQLLFVGDPGQVSRFVNLAIYSYLGGFLIARYIGHLQSLLWILLSCVTAQAVILIFGFGNGSFRGWIDSNIMIGANFDAFNSYRAVGLTSSAGSALSVTQSLGVLCGGWLIYLGTRAGAQIRTGLIIVFMLICLVSCAITGRTGLYLSFLFLAFSAYFSGAHRFLLYVFPIGIIVFFVNESLLLRFVSNDVSMDWLLNWMLGVFSPDDETLSSLSSMPLPPLNAIESWIGHGRVSLIDGMNPSENDSGFVQAVYSMGIVFGTLFYCAYFYVLGRLLNWLPVVYKISILLLLFLIEIKEPFVFKYTVVFVLVAVNALAGRENRIVTLKPDRV